jgi:hypothetical protein
MFITAKEARALSSHFPQPESIASAELVCRQIQEAANRGNQFLITELPLSESDQDWLERNGFMVWRRPGYMAVRWLILWHIADEMEK